MNKLQTDQQLYYQLSYYTLSHRDSEFIHQCIVDAFTAQTATEKTKPIAISFALIGLYLAVEKHWTGRQVQLAHMLLSKKRKSWLTHDLPKDRGSITVSDVLKVPEGPHRDEMIVKWCASVWKAFESSHQKVIDLVHKELG
jgi:hypothetical protein